MELWEATAHGLRLIEEALTRPVQRERRCEICNDALGAMTAAAYAAAHQHCDRCAPTCEECQEAARA